MTIKEHIQKSEERTKKQIFFELRLPRSVKYIPLTHIHKWLLILHKKKKK